MALVPLILGESEQEEGTEGGKAGVVVVVVVEGGLIYGEEERGRGRKECVEATCFDKYCVPVCVVPDIIRGLERPPIRCR